MRTLYIFINGEKKYFYIPKVNKPSYWIARDVKTGVPMSYRTYYRVNLDGTPTDETLVYNYNYLMSSTYSTPKLSGHKFDDEIQRTIIYHSNCDSVAQGTEATMYYRIYDANMHQIKELTHSIMYPSTTSSSTYNNNRHLLLTMFSGYFTQSGQPYETTRYLRIIDLVNLRILTKSFTWSNGKESQVLSSWYDENTKKLRVLCKNWYNPGSSSTQAVAISVYDVNLTSDEYDVNPIFSYKFNDVTNLANYSFLQGAIPYAWDSPKVSIYPMSAANARNMFFMYDFINNEITSTNYTQSYISNSVPGYGGLITSPNGNDYIALYIKWDGLSDTSTNLYRWSLTNGLTTPTSSLGDRRTNMSYISCWNKDYCLGVAGSDSTAGVGKAAIYWTDNNNAYNYYNPTIYEATSGNPISSTSSGSIDSNTSSTKYLAINKRENTSNPVKYMNVIDKDNIQNTIKLDLSTNSAFATDGWNSWSGFFTY